MIPEQGPTPVIVCLKWGAGYPATYTNVLFRSLRRIMKTPYRFVCLTDAPEGLDPGIETLPLPPIALPRERWVPGMWPKLCVFAPGLFAPGTPVMLLDVDVVVLRDLGPLFERVRHLRGLHIIADWPDTLERWFPRVWRKERGSNSSLVGFVAGEQDHMFERFAAADYEQLRADWNDQTFMHRHARDRQYWPDGWVLSFKKNLAYHFPVNLVRPIRRPDAFVVAFHGRPNPSDLAQRPFRRWGSAEKFGYFPVPWVRDYWEAAANDTQGEPDEKVAG